MTKQTQKSAQRIEFWPLDRLRPYARNARTHDDRQIDKIAASIAEFGFTNPILVDSKDGIIAGHGRLMAARKLELETVPVIVLDHMTDAQRRAYILADNRLALDAGWDDAMLAAELEALQDDGFDLALTGFTDDEISDLLEGVEAEQVPEGDPDVAPVLRKDAVSVRGDLWLLGRHRIICGSCTDQHVVDAVVKGDRVDLCLTDPPYGLGKAKQSGKNDYLEYDDTRDNLIALAADWLPIARSISPAVVFSPGVTNQWIYPEPEWVICWFYGGGQLRSSWGFNCWQPFLCYGKDPSLATGNGGRPDAVNLNTPANSGDLDHPCPKPVKLWEWLIDRLVFKDKAVIYEPFSGSGTTIISAEIKGHSVRAIELTPHYVDLAVRRWQDFTGKKATLESTGQTFDEIAAGKIGANDDGAIDAAA